MKEKTRGYAHRIDLAADVQTVWRALTDPTQLITWCSPQAEIRARAGGLFRACVDRVTELEAHIDVFEPERRMRLIYLPSAALPPADSALVDDFILEPDARARGTILRLLGSGVPGSPEWDAQYLRLRTGWQAAMTRLKALIEGAARREGT
ncbi:MAG TPA: SRPBCC domain-containing protein [Steroidobacteraceae bacterium]|nr:SRPBCC domain-containing protein [Steroidobacteraceae bacterium]